jgi:hypothetical protein
MVFHAWVAYYLLECSELFACLMIHLLWVLLCHVLLLAIGTPHALGT